MISVAIPTIGRTEVLNSVIMSLFNQHDQIGEAIILDEADTPIMEAYQVNQALDLLSLQGIPVTVIRNRQRKGIGHARYALVEKCSSKYVLMVDDDVVLGNDCIRLLKDSIKRYEVPWVVPHCLLVRKERENYIDTPVDFKDPKIQDLITKYPWFTPYFRYTSEVVVKIPVSGTQAILLDREVFLKKCGVMQRFGKLPREDTYMTAKMGKGIFISSAECFHFNHEQQDRFWSRTMFYKIHTCIQEDPDLYAKFIAGELT